MRGAVFLDLFCGGGAVGLEALSRGAEGALFVDADGARLEVARQNASSLGVADRCVFHKALLPKQWQSVVGRIRSESPLVAFADPPYDFEDYPAIAHAIQKLPNVTAMAIEHSTRTQWLTPWSPSERRDYGESALTLCEVP